MVREPRTLVMTPRALFDAALAIAGSRTGAIGVLDIGSDPSSDSARRAVADLVRLGSAEVGLRLELGGDETAATALLAQFAAGSFLVLAPGAGASAGEWPSFIQRFARQRGLRILAEVGSADEAAAAEASHVDGLIAKGSEAGGRAAHATTFVLLQELLQRFTIPVWAQGAIDDHTAAACAAAGAAGVVLCDELALVRESMLPADVRDAIAIMDGGETVVVGTELGQPFRFFRRPGCAGADEIKRRYDEAFAATDSVAWTSFLQSACNQTDGPIGWKSDQAWPLGQSACLAARLAERFHTTGGVVAGIAAAVRDHLACARRQAPLASGSALARSHATTFPIVQGPMTRVSDVAPFAAEVARAGALPFIALALMRGAEVDDLLVQTQAALGDRPWGVGILGFVPRELRDEQLAAVRRIRPRFALVAGGRPDHAAALEADGIATYLHVPSPKLLELFHAQAARRFVFEGGECGGHIGPRSSFVLWSQMVSCLLKIAGNKSLDDVHVLFAGGIHDARSAAMVSALAAPLAERGAKIGVLMGTAYLFTEEAVKSGAIVPGYQKVALECRITAVLETGPGHVTRCAPTEFARLFVDEKRRLLSDRRPAEEVRETLEHLNLGKLRLAAKGVDRNPEYTPGGDAPKLVTVDAERQPVEGMYMIGQVAALRDQVTTMAELHRSVSDGAQELLAATEETTSISVTPPAPQPLDVAIVGMSCLLPGATDIPTFWDNVLNGRETIGEVPSDRWDWRQYFDGERSARDKVYSRWGGFLPELPFDPMSYGIPPSSLKSIEPLQLLTLEVIRAALADAGLVNREFPRQRASVVLGAGGGVADLGNRYAVRAALPQLFDGVPSEVWDRLPEWTEDSFPGLLLNVAAGRAANRFDFGGINMTVDAACASSLAAIYVAAQELAAGRSDVVVAGGVDTVQNPFGYLCFSKTQALSPRGKSRVFDASADGIVISEGLAVVVLKRRADAERDGDRIYAVLRGVGGSSDGRGRSMTAPRPEGQMRAVERAYQQAGYSPATVGLFEAHGTGTAAGDVAEAETLRRILEGAGAQSSSAAVGSVKSMIGHTKCAAGVTGLIKAALSLHRKVLPPTINVEQPNPKAGFGEGPLYVNSELRPWIARAVEHPRRAGVSAFGFGGTNFHVALEEYCGDPPSLPQPATAGAWPAELLLFKGERAVVADGLGRLAADLTSGARPRLRDLARSCWEMARRNQGDVTVAILASDLEVLPRRLSAMRDAVISGRELIDPAGGWYLPVAPKGKLAMVFPGQGSQYTNMFRDLAIHFRVVREEIERAERVLSGSFDRPLAEQMYPPPAFTPEERKNREGALRRTRVAQPALGAVELGGLRLLTELGIAPAMVAGHSYGEYAALTAAGVFTADDLARVSEARGRWIVEAATGDLGTMAAVAAGPETVSEVIAGLPDVWVANYNAPLQTVLSGTQGAIKGVIERFAARGIQAQQIPVSCGFHSPLVAEARTQLANVLRDMSMSAPRIPVYSNATAGEYPADPDAGRALLSEHLVTPVRFSQEIDAMYEAGARVFVEVGPKTVLTGLIDRCLGERPHLALALDRSDRSGLLQLQHLVGTLAAAGISVNLDPLFAGRGTKRHDLGRLIDETRIAPLPASTWMVSGGRVRPIAESVVIAPPVNLTPIAPIAQPEFVASDRVGLPQDVRAANAPVARGEEVRPPARPIAAATVDALPVIQEFQRAMAQLIESQERVMLAYLGGSVPQNDERFAEAAVPAAVRPQAVGSAVPFREEKPRVEEIVVEAARQPVVVEQRMTHENVLAALVNVVVERTGYPRELVDVEASLEADLGIDSIKRVEIVGELWRAIPHGLAQPPQGLMEELTSAPTLARIASRLASMLTGSEGERVGRAAAPAEAAVGARVSVEDVRARLLQIVVERTGYPADLLDENASLEADLGIDSIKRVEIVGELWRSIPHGLEQPPQGLMEELTSAPSLSQIAVRLAAALAGSPQASAAPAAPTASAAERRQLSPADVRARLLQIVVERTGYPAELLDENASLEADLGIDSIKRVEIVGELWRTLPHGLEQPPQGLMEELTSAPSLTAMVARLTRVLNGVPAAGPATAAAPATSLTDEVLAAADPAPQSALPRFAMKPIRIEPPASAELPKGTVLVTDDGCGIAAALRLALRERGISVQVIDSGDLDPGADRAASAAAPWLTGDIAAAVYLPALDEDTSPFETSAAAWRDRLRSETGRLFALIQAVTPVLAAGARAEARPRFLCATGLGGDFGLGARSEHENLPASHGGLCGLTKTLAVERPNLLVKVVDLDARASAEVLAECLMLELLSDDDEAEVGWRNGERWVPRPVSATLRSEGAPLLDAESVVLLTGGARGITAEIAVEIAERFRSRLVLLGRAAQPRDEAPETAGRDGAALKAALVAERQRQGRSAALPEIEADYRRVLAEREMRATFQRLDAAGSGWEYLAGDVCDEQDVQGALGYIRSQYGRLDAVIHGAGVIEDKLLSDKKWESFARVFETKAVSAQILAHALGDFLGTLRFVAFFTSVAGAFANRGQADYVAGNEVANKLARVLSDRWAEHGCRVVALNWGPWQKGMASDLVQQQFRARGIEPIPVAAGCRALVSELSSRDGAAVLVLGEGPWSRVADAQSDGGASYPILAAARRRADGTPFSIDRVLDVAVDHFIDDHRLDGRPVLPMTVALEMMTELAAAGWPEMVVTDVRNVAVLKGIVFTESDHLRHAVRLEAPAVDGSASGVTVHVNMRSGANAEQLHYRATFELKPSAPAPARHQAADVRREFPLSVQDAYRQYLFHGPRFAHIAQIDGLSERGLLARIRPSEPGSCITGATGDWLIDPVALDSALQMVILWARAVHDVTPLPARFKRYRRFGGLRSREGALMRCELVASADAQAHLVTADLTFFEEDGTVIGVLEGLECTASRELNRLAGAGEALGVPVR